MKKRQTKAQNSLARPNRSQTALRYRLTLGLLLLNACTYQLDDPLPIHPRMVVDTLPNGLRFIHCENNWPPEHLELRLVIDVGSMVESEGERGVAHFVEHMAFNGTTHFDPEEIFALAGEMGVSQHFNAFTSADATVYKLAVPPDSTKKPSHWPLSRRNTASRIVNDWAYEIRFAPEEVERERGVIIEEWRRKQSLFHRSAEYKNSHLWAGTPYADRNPIGRRSVLDTVSAGTLERFYKKWYRPEHTTLIALGDDAGKFPLGFLERWGSVQPPPLPSRPEWKFETALETHFAAFVDSARKFRTAGLYYRLAPRSYQTIGEWREFEIEKIRLAMLRQRLEARVNEADPPFLQTQVGRISRNKGVFLYLSAHTDRDYQSALVALLTEIRRIDVHGFSTDELAREIQVQRRWYKRKVREAWKLDTLRFFDWLKLGKYKPRLFEMLRNREFNSVDEANRLVHHVNRGLPFMSRLQSYHLVETLLPGITLDEVNDWSPVCSATENRLIFLAGPDPPGPALADSAARTSLLIRLAAAEVAPYQEHSTDRAIETVEEEDIKLVLPSAAIVERRTIPELGLQVWRFENGAEVWLKPDNTHNAVALHAFRHGGLLTLPEKDRLSGWYAGPLVRHSGAGSIDRRSIQRLIKNRGLSLYFNIFRDISTIEGSGPFYELESLLALVHRYFTAPWIDPLTSRLWEFKRSKFRSKFKEAQFNLVDPECIRCGDPQAQPGPERALEIFRDRFGDGGNFDFLLVGPFNLEQVEPLIRSYLGSLPSTSRREPLRDQQVQALPQRVRRTVYEDQELRSRVFITFSGAHSAGSGLSNLDRPNPPHLAAELLRLRLFDELREASGGTYDVSVTVEERSLGWREEVHVFLGMTRFVVVPQNPYAVIKVFFECAPARVPELIETVLSQVEALREEGPSASHLVQFQEQLRRERMDNLRNSTFWARSLIKAMRFGSDPVGILEYADRIDSLTAAAVQRAARRYLDPQTRNQLVQYPQSWQAEAERLQAKIPSAPDL